MDAGGCDDCQQNGCDPEHRSILTRTIPVPLIRVKGKAEVGWTRGRVLKNLVRYILFIIRVLNHKGPFVGALPIVLGLGSVAPELA